MTGWIIFGGVLLLLLLCLLSPVSLRAGGRDGAFSAEARYLFLRFDLSAEALDARAKKRAAKEEKKKAKKPPDKEKEEEAKAKEKKKKTLAERWQQVKVLQHSSKRALSILRRHTIVSKVAIYLCVGSDDAHRTAIRCVQFKALALAFLDVIGLLFVLKPPKIGIAPDFTAQNTRYDISLRISIRPLFVFGALFSFLFRFLAAKQPRTQKPRAQRKQTAKAA